MTALDLLAAAIRAKAGVSGSMVRPAAILWTDASRDWCRLLPAARLRIPELLVLGDYRPEERTGPAIWLRCVIDGTIELPDLPGGCTPAIYLPGVERGNLRAGENCPEHLRPLVELLYRGVPWHHPNGRDWSVRAFLTLRAAGVPAGPGLDIADDSETREALLRAIGEVAQTPLDELRGRLDANAFNRIAGVDIERDILRWLGNPAAIRETMEDARWDAFRDEARRVLRFDPQAGSDVEAGAKLAQGKGRWRDVWSRFREAPESFQGVAEVLRRSRPQGELVLEGRDCWPDINDEDEMSVRVALGKLPSLPQPAACAEIARLETEHGQRREWVWAKMKEAPLAEALRPLARLAEAVGESVGGATPDDIARVYAERGWQADRSAREALALANPKHEELIAGAIRHLTEPWLDQSARAFQAAVRDHPLPSVRAGPVKETPSTAYKATHSTVATAPMSPVAATEQECLLFVDGLRYELGRCLVELLREHGLTTMVRSRWAAIPTVTATAKPAVTPVADRIAGDHLSADFQPVVRGSGRPASAGTLREAMRERGYEIVRDDALGLGPPPAARGWCETGRIDYHGHHYHQEAAGFARLVESELDRLARRVVELIEAGWTSVRIVTDHGWLLLPGGLPKVKLPKHLTESKWARAAVLAGEAKPDAPLHPWHWNPDERFASPPGIACFSKEPEYAHGGLSVQECLIPDIRISAKAADEGMAHVGLPRTVIRSVSWLRMRCNLMVDRPGAGTTADLRLGSPSGESVASSPKAIDADGCASLILRDEDHEDAALVLVVIASDGRVLAHRMTRLGDPPA